MTRKSAEPAPAATSPPLKLEPFWLVLLSEFGRGLVDVVRLLFILAGFGLMLGIVIVVALFVVRVLT